MSYLRNVKRKFLTICHLDITSLIWQKGKVMTFYIQKAKVHLYCDIVLFKNTLLTLFTIITQEHKGRLWHILSDTDLVMLILGAHLKTVLIVPLSKNIHCADGFKMCVKHHILKFVASLQQHLHLKLCIHHTLVGFALDNCCCVMWWTLFLCSLRKRQRSSLKCFLIVYSLYFSHAHAPQCTAKSAADLFWQLPVRFQSWGGNEEPTNNGCEQQQWSLPVQYHCSLPATTHMAGKVSAHACIFMNVFKDT